jgi:hypothetical protein
LSESEKITICGLEFERIPSKPLPDGRWTTTIYLGDPRKATTNLWAKKLKNVDVTKLDGRAFEGVFLRNKGKYLETELVMENNEIVVAVTESGSWRHPNQVLRVYVCRDGIYRTELPWGSEAKNIEAIHAVAKVFQEVVENREIKIARLKKLIEEKKESSPS